MPWFATDEGRPDIGILWENWVIAEVAKRNALLGSPAKLHFWRSHAQSEVDLVLQMSEGLRAFEIQWTSRRTVGRAFNGVEVAAIGPDDPFAPSILA
jgi:uncharacterized protein